MIDKGMLPCKAKDPEEFSQLKREILSILESYSDSVLQNVPEIAFTSPQTSQGFSKTKSNLGVLFSGGLDSTILAKLAA